MDSDICMDNVYLFIEPFYGGSHRQLIDTLLAGLNNRNGEVCLITMSAKKWHWRARTSSLYLSQVIPTNHNFKTLFASSVLCLAELIALRTDLASLKKVIYFHENQLVYPVRKEKERDFQYGYNQILTCLVADVILFNSNYNLTSFLDSIQNFMKLQPDYRPKNLKAVICPKCEVLYFPIAFPKTVLKRERNDSQLHIVWPHRWEHDKNPELFFKIMFELAEEGMDFKVSVLGERYSASPSIFGKALDSLKNYINQWGFVSSKQEYYDILLSSHVVVSTAKHEFFGVAMLECAYSGCYPLCPDDLVYPELYPEECLYRDEFDLKNKLF